MRMRLIAATALIPLMAACGGGSSGGDSTAGAATDGGSAAGGGGGIAATCVAPTLTVKPAKVQPGDRVQVSGEWFADGCNDTAINGQPPQPAPAITGMTLEVSQGDQSWPVATDVDAEGETYAFEVSIEIPRDLHAGKATVQAKDYGFPADIEVVQG